MKPTTLRFYEQAGLLPAARSEWGYRLYDEQAVERLGFIASGTPLITPWNQHPPKETVHDTQHRPEPDIRPAGIGKRKGDWGQGPDEDLKRPRIMKK